MSKIHDTQDPSPGEAVPILVCPWCRTDLVTRYHFDTFMTPAGPACVVMVACVNCSKPVPASVFPVAAPKKDPASGGRIVVPN